MEQEFGVDSVTGNFSPRDLGGSYSFPLYHQPGAWGRGVYLLLFGLLVGPSTLLSCRCPFCPTLGNINIKNGRWGNRKACTALLLSLRDWPGYWTGRWGSLLLFSKPHCSAQGLGGNALWNDLNCWNFRWNGWFREE